MSEAWIAKARQQFHSNVLAQILTVDGSSIPSNADSGSKPSIAIASGILEKLGTPQVGKKISGQQAGALFEEICASFVESCFSRLGHLRPGTFDVSRGIAINQFEQYSHLFELEKVAKSNSTLATAIGADYLIKPDIVVGRRPEKDDAINNLSRVVDERTGTLTGLRASNQSQSILHASISCKWTLRSDRAQNARSEGLNLVRNRKGRLPSVVVVTGEPTPNRIASLALGTGDIDCVYHFALYELRETLVEQEREETLELLDMMTNGKRLRDISDLPLDLVV